MPLYPEEFEARREKMRAKVRAMSPTELAASRHRHQLRSGIIGALRAGEELGADASERAHLAMMYAHLLARTIRNVSGGDREDAEAMKADFLERFEKELAAIEWPQYWKGGGV